MCGIFAYTGKKEAVPIILDGLTTLEYRGYDSAGIYVDDLGVVKAVGEVSNLRKKLPIFRTVNPHRAYLTQGGRHTVCRQRPMHILIRIARESFSWFTME